MRDLQSANKRGCGYIFTTVGNLGKPFLKVADVELEPVTLSHLDEEEVMIIFLGLLVGGVLGEERLDYLLETVERTQ